MKKIIALLLMSTMVLAGCSQPAASSEAPADSSSTEASTAATAEPAEETPANPLEGQTIVVGCSSTFVPFESVTVNADGSKDHVGMNIDIMEAIAEKNGATIEFSDMPFKSLIGAIQAGHIDMNIGGMTPTDERRESLDFSEIYFYPRNAIVYQDTNSYPDLASLDGKTVAYAFGTNYEKVVNTIPNVNGVGIQGSPACIEEVKTGRADAAVIDGAGATEFIKVNEGLTLSLLEKQEADAFSIGFPKDSPYYETVNNTLIEMMENGELDAIIANHLSEEFIID